MTSKTLSINYLPRSYINLILFSFYLQRTGLTGLAVAKHPHTSLKHYYERLLAITSKMPTDAAYRINTEAIVQSRLSIIDKVGTIFIPYDYQSTMSISCCCDLLIKSLIM